MTFKTKFDLFKCKKTTGDKKMNKKVTKYFFCIKHLKN